MPYTTPPTFVDGAPLSASQLNTLSDNQAYFAGLAQAANIPFARQTDAFDGAASYWQCRHRSQYLNLYVEWGVDVTWVDHIALEISIDGDLAHDENLAGTSAKYIAIDLEDLGSPPAPGAWYEIEVNAITEDDTDSYVSIVGVTYFYVARLYEAATDESL